MFGFQEERRLSIGRAQSGSPSSRRGEGERRGWEVGREVG